MRSRSSFTKFRVLGAMKGKYRVLGAMKGDFGVEEDELGAIYRFSRPACSRPPDPVNRLVDRKLQLLDLENFPYLIWDDFRPYFSYF